MSTKEKADEIIARQLAKLISNPKAANYNYMDVVISCILSVEHTIEVLEELKMSMDGNNYALDDVDILIDEQNELLTELKSRL